MYLEHHGIKGQKWGVRRFQNADGTLTSLGRERKIGKSNIARNKPYTDDVNEIVRTLSPREKELLGADKNEDWIDKEWEWETLSNKANTFVTKIGNKPVSFLEIWTNGTSTGQIALATRNDPKYRNKGLASKNVEKAIKWTEQYGKYTIKELEWWAEKSNTGSNKLAKQYGFKKVSSHGDKDWNRYLRKVNRKE